jgi:serine/threonine-protein kinase
VARRFGNYVAEGELGRGGMGVVYRARHPELGRVAAVKVLAQTRADDADGIARFFDEARAASAIRHPGIVEVFDLGKTEEGDAYYVMELLQGESLAEVLARGPLAPADAARIAIDVAGALGAAHAAGIVHRDLKPANVFVTAGGGVKVLDFGVAKLMGGAIAARGAAPTVDGAVMGTPHYMAPEQGMGRPVDARADIYSLGAILYEALCGQRPFEGESLLSVAMKHATEALVAPTERPLGKAIPAALERVVLRAMAKTPGERYQSMTEMKAALRAAVGEPSTPGLDRTLPAPSASTPSGRAAAYTAGEPPSLMPQVTQRLAPARTGWLVGAGAVLLVGWLVFLSVKSGGADGCAAGTGTGSATGVVTAAPTGAPPATAAPVEAMRPPLAPRSAASSDAAYAAYLRGMDAWAKFRLGDAARSFGEAATLDPDFPQPHLMIALYGLVGTLSLDEHLARAEAMAFKLTADERLQLEIARAVNREPADQAGAAALLETRTTRFPGDVLAWFKLGESRAALLDDAGALAALDRAVALAPSFLPARNSRAYVLERLGRTDEALREIDQYILATPSEPNGYDTRAEILLYAGRVDEAKKALGTALALDPKFAESLAKTALIQLHEGDAEGAQKLLPLVEATPPSEQSVWLSVRVGMALATGRVGEGLSMLAAAVGVVPAPIVQQAVDAALKWTAFAGLGADARTLRDRVAALGGPRVERARLLYAARFDPASWSDSALDGLLSINAERGGALAAGTRRGFFLGMKALGAGRPDDITKLVPDPPGVMNTDAALLLLHGIGLLAVGDAAGAERALFRADVAGLLHREPALELVSRYHRARALEALGRRDEARVEYGAVIAAWAKADRAIDLVNLAKTALAKMGPG